MKINKVCEKKMKEVYTKSNSNLNLTCEDVKVLSVINRMKIYLDEYDTVEGSCLLKVFTDLFLITKNRVKTIQALALEICYDKRTVINHKKKIIKIFICFYKKYS